MNSLVTFLGIWSQKILQWCIGICRDILAITLVAMGIVSLLCCLSYSPEDSSFLQAAGDEVGNWFGLYGSTYADFILQTLGYGAYVISGLLIIWGSGLFRGKIATSLIIRLMYMPPVLMLFSGALEMFLGYFAGPANNGTGGHIGTAVASTILYFPSKIGFIAELATKILVTSFSLLGILFLSGRSFLKISIPELVASDETDEETNETTHEKKPLPLLSSLLKPTKKKEAEVQANEESDYEDSPLGNFGKSNKKKSPAKAKFIYELPETELLQSAPSKKKDPTLSEEVLQHNAQLLESVLEDFGVKGTIQLWHPGPVVTLYELEPAAGIRSSRVIGLADDIARAMSAIAARVAVIPGKNAIGIELPNIRRETVYLKDIITHDEYQNSNKELPLGLGKDIGGMTVATDLAKMPHLLIAGTTGSGKSVGINTMILSLLYKLSPAQCKMIMIDPKMLELSIYNGIPHLLTPVVTNPKKAVCALKWVVREMEERYDMMSKVGVRKLSAFNDRIAEAKKNGEVLTRKKARGFDPATGQPVEEEEVIDLNPLPYIVVIVDEMADLMMVAGKEIEGLIQRLAQMARAAGIHLIMATQRPSVDVITGTIKANFPTRISFQVTSKIDSRTILGEQGAEQLLGQGDMLFMESGGRIRRVHGAFVSDTEVENIVESLKTQGEPLYIDDITADPDEEQSSISVDAEGLDPMFQEAVEVVKRDQKISTSYVQRKLKIGYNRAARIIEEMEEQGIISAPDHTGKREILA